MEVRLITIGVDVHKATNSVCAFEANNHKYEVLFETVLPTGVDPMVKFLEKFKKLEGLTEENLLIGYEAGPTGNGLCRGLRSRGYRCCVVAPSTMAKAPGDRVKTDRLDARKLAKALAFDAVKIVYVTDYEDECVRDLCMCRQAEGKNLAKAKTRLMSFLLKHGVTYSEGEYWTRKFERWLASIKFDNPKLQLVFERYYQDVYHLMEVCDQLDEEIEKVADEPRYQENVDKLVCFPGIKTYIALSFLCEIGDFHRFPTAKRFASFMGLVPGQDSSGQRTMYTHITKNGNSHLRKLLTEATKAIVRTNPFKKSKRILARQRGQSPNIIAYADRAKHRIKTVMKNITSRNKHTNIATTAGARELANFIWGMMTGRIN